MRFRTRRRVPTLDSLLGQLSEIVSREPWQCDAADDCPSDDDPIVVTDGQSKPARFCRYHASMPGLLTAYLLQADYAGVDRYLGEVWHETVRGALPALLQLWEQTYDDGGKV